jgi:tripartite-type tricarboxylate transporter receptor subunit TctC
MVARSIHSLGDQVLVRTFFLTVCLLLGAAVSSAQGSFPNAPIRLIVPFASGGSTDSLSRIIAEQLQSSLGQPVVVDNRPGGFTNLAVGALLQAKRDGYTLLHAENSSLYLNQHLFARPQFRSDVDFSFIAPIGRFPVILVVGGEVPARTLSEFIAYAKANPTTVSYASPGIGTLHNVAMELFKQKADFRVQHIPYRGGAAAMQDVLGGRVAAMMADLTNGTVHQYIKQGKLRMLAVAAKNRLPGYPDVPTFAEAGYPAVIADGLHGVVAAAGTPVQVIQRLNESIEAAVNSPKLTAFVANTGFERVTGTPEDFKKLTLTEGARWAKVIKDAGIQLE